MKKRLALLLLVPMMAIAISCVANKKACHRDGKCCKKANNADAVEFSLSSNSVTSDDALIVTFAKPLMAKENEKYWITVIPVGTPDSDWGQWKYVDNGAREIELAVPETPGKYEVRLHGNYPTKGYNVVGRKALTVKAK